MRAGCLYGRTAYSRQPAESFGNVHRRDRAGSFGTGADVVEYFQAGIQRIHIQLGREQPDFSFVYPVTRFYIFSPFGEQDNAYVDKLLTFHPGNKADNGIFI